MSTEHQKSDNFPWASPHYLDNGSGAKMLQPKHRVDYSTDPADLANALVLAGIMHAPVEEGQQPFGMNHETQRTEYTGRNVLPAETEENDNGTTKVPVVDTAQADPKPVE